jgi:hypothetical protein
MIVQVTSSHQILFENAGKEGYGVQKLKKEIIHLGTPL